MPPRKPHSKSRRGCHECKRRHTKCNEHHPRCSTCTRLGIDCTWPDWKPRNASPAPPPETNSRASTPSLVTRFDRVSKHLPEHDTISPSSDALAIDDLRLLHHFTSKTYSTMDPYSTQKEIWRDFLIETGFQHHFLLRGILALSALHLATLHPEVSTAFVIQATKQHDLALPEFRTVLSYIGEDNCVAVFAFSFITVIHAFAVSQIHPPQEPIADLLNCIRLVQGVATVLGPHFETLRKGELRYMLESAPDEDIEGQIDEILRLKDLVALLPDGNDGDSKAYLDAIVLLNQISTETQRSDHEKSFLSLLFSWPALLSAEFTFALSSYEPIALIILTHFVTILGSKKKVWWIMSSNARILDDVESRLSPHLLHWLVWPKQMCNTG